MSISEGWLTEDKELLHTGYVPLEEEIPMTMQVCLIGKDGFVFASDRKNVTFGRDKTTTTFMTEKIYCNQNWRAAWCSSGHWTTDVICQKLHATLQEAESRQRNLQVLIDHLRQIVEEHSLTFGADVLGNGKVMLVMEEDAIKGYSVDIGWPGGKGNWCAFNWKVFTDKQYLGDTRNSAVFFAESYYRSDATVNVLVPLAAHVILAAAKLNPSGIGGLEIIVGGAGDLRKLTGEEIDSLTATSIDLDNMLKHRFAQPSLYRSNSAIVQMWSERPDSIAGVTRSVLCTRQKL